MRVNIRNTSKPDKDIGISHNFFKNLAGYNSIKDFTVEGLVDELFLCQVFTREVVSDRKGEHVTVSKYYLQAWKLQRQISVGNPSPFYILNISDLPAKLVKAIKELDEETQNYVITRAIGRIFENINPRVFHLSIARRLRWKLEYTR